jgi:nitroreductase
MKNPYLSMLATAWRYARHERKRYVLIYSMFIMANLIAAAHPLLYGWFVDSLQRDGASVMSFAWVYGLGYLGLRVLEWCFTVPPG